MTSAPRCRATPADALSVDFDSMSTTGGTQAAREGRVTTVTDENRADISERRRFVILVVAFAVLFTAVGRMYGEDIALELQKTPTTALGWRLIGWLVAGPPLVFTMMVWHERRRLTRKQWRDRSWLLAAWIGLNMFVLPARTTSTDSQFGTAALVGDPLGAGWAWG